VTPPILIPAKQFSVWSRLYNRFQLEPEPAVGSNAFVSPVIQPITDADRLLKTPVIAAETVSVTAIGSVVFHTVPLGDRWTLLAQRAARASGTMTFTFFEVGDPSAVVMQLNQFASQAESQLYEYKQGVNLDEGWTIRVFFDAHSVVGDVTSTILYEREDAF